MKRRRSEINIINDIIKVTLTRKNETVTRLQEQTDLSYDVFQKYLTRMIKKKLILKNTLLPTPKGMAFHRDAEKILKLETKLNKNL